MDTKDLRFDGYEEGKNNPDLPGWYWYRPLSDALNKGTLIFVLFDGQAVSYHDALSGEVQLEPGYWQGPIKEPKFHCGGLRDQLALEVYEMRQAGAKFAEIAQRFNLKLWKVRDKYRRAKWFFDMQAFDRRAKAAPVVVVDPLDAQANMSAHQDRLRVAREAAAQALLARSPLTVEQRDGLEDVRRFLDRVNSLDLTRGNNAQLARLDAGQYATVLCKLFPEVN